MPSPTDPPSKALVARRIRTWIEAYLEDPRRKRISSLNKHLTQYRESHEVALIKEAARMAKIMEGKSGDIETRDMPEGAMTTKVYSQVAESVNNYDMEGDVVSCSGVYEDLVEQFPELKRRSVQNFTSKVFRTLEHKFPEEFKVDVAPWALEGKRGRGKLPTALFRLKGKTQDFTPHQLRTMVNARETDKRRDKRRSTS